MSKYYNYENKEIEKEVFNLLKKEQLLIHGNCFIEHWLDNVRILDISKLICVYDNSGNIISIKENE